MSAPNIDTKVVYEACVNSISDVELRNRLSLLNNDIVLAARDYQKMGEDSVLYKIQPNNHGNDDIALGSVTKKELTSVYTMHLVNKTKPARQYYDELLLGAPFGRCPFCGIGQVATLDHYLPKTKFPQLSIVPLNLVPSCRDCNSVKSTSIATTAAEQCLHPYFDHSNYIYEQWLYAEVVCTAPATIRFFVQAPAHWDDVSKERVQSHIRDFKLDNRYSIEACNQIASLRDMLSNYQEIGVENVKQHLRIEARVHFKIHRNSWQTAMFQALADSDWYCNGGFKAG